MRKVALLTAGTSKIGKHIAGMLQDMNFDIAIHYHSASSAGEAEKLLRKGVIKLAIQADFTVLDSPAKILDAVESIYPQIDLLINNASIFELDTNLDFSAQDLERHIKINAIAPIVLIKEIFKRQQRLCKVINMLDINTNKLTNKHFSYNLSKRMLQSACSLIMHTKPDAWIKNLYLDKIDSQSKLQAILQELRRAI
jgi:NAD(P)-dependent dehydrogenase (short-subunit alcohol dehydrogenase family)